MKRVGKPKTEYMMAAVCGGKMKGHLGSLVQKDPGAVHGAGAENSCGVCGHLNGTEEEGMAGKRRHYLVCFGEAS